MTCYDTYGFVVPVCWSSGKYMSQLVNKVRNNLS